jgi:hypothetical protein
MIMTFSKRFLRLSLGSVSGLAALLIEKCLTGNKLAFAQMTLWTVLVFGFMAIQFDASLLRPRQFYVALSLVVLHIVALIRLADRFPLNNMVAGLIWIGVEIVILGLLYIRIGQAVDPEGPFGPSDAEIRERRIKNSSAK